MNDGFDNARQYAAVVGDTVGGAVDNVRQEIANVGDLIHNARQYVSGRIINPNRGRYTRVPRQSESHVQSQSNEPPIINLTDEIMPGLNENATRIQKMVRGKRARKQTEEKKYINQISKDLDENMARSRNEETERINELDQILRQDAKE